jgi:hypothetical protein
VSREQMCNERLAREVLLDAAFQPTNERGGVMNRLAGLSYPRFTERSGKGLRMIFVKCHSATPEFSEC